MSVNGEPLHWLSVAELLAAYRRGDTNPVAVTSALLTRIERLNPDLCAFEQVFSDTALAAARSSAERWAAAEASPNGIVRPLEGIPVAVKDLLTTVEGPTTVGTAFLASYLPREDAPVVRKLRDAGAIILGKTAMTEGAFALHHPERRTPINPWARDRSPGVSSSGSAVALAAGLCPLALGTDTGGSIRFPSGNNRLVGLKPTKGTVDAKGCFPLSTWLDHIGPMVRSVDDLDPVLSAMGWTPRRLPRSTGRIAVDQQQVARRCDPAVHDLFQSSLAALQAQGYELVDCDLDAAQWGLAAGWLDRVGVSAQTAHREFLANHSEDYGPAFTWLLQHGARVGTDRLHELEHLALVWKSQLDQVLADVDALVCPVSPYPNPRLGHPSAPPSPDSIAKAVQFTAPFNFSGHPALTLPMGFIDGAPSGLQLIGRAHEEAGLIAMGSSMQRSTPWSDRPAGID